MKIKDMLCLDSTINWLRYYSLYRRIYFYCPKGEKILDFGCGKGELLFYLRKKGYRVYGMDPLIETGNLFPKPAKFIFSSLSNLKKNLKKNFKLIVLNFSLEHCDNPLKILKQLQPLLSGDGYIFIRVPNFNFILTHKNLGSFQLKIPEHCYFFTIENLSDLLQKSGFIITSINTPFCLTSMLTIACSIFPRLDPMLWLGEKKLLIKLGKGICLAILCFIFSPYILLKSKKEKGAVIYATAQNNIR